MDTLGDYADYIYIVCINWYNYADKVVHFGMC